MVLTIILAIMAAILFIGMIGDDDKDNRRNFTYAFIVTIVAIIIINR